MEVPVREINVETLVNLSRVGHQKNRSVLRWPASFPLEWPFPLHLEWIRPRRLAEPAGPGVQQSNFLAQDLLTLSFPIDKPYRGIASLPHTVEGFAANITAIFDQQFFWNCSVNLDRTRATIS